MAPTRITSFQDGPRITVNSMLKNPTLVPARVLSLLNQQFIVDRVLRTGPAIPSGALIYHESTPLYAEDNAAVVEEFGAIPATVGDIGIPRTARSVKRALAIRISQEMADRNDVDAVNTQITQVKNTMVRTWEDAFLATATASFPTLAASAASGWVYNTSPTAGTGFFYDLAHAIFDINNADSDSSNGMGSQKFGFEPDTVIINTMVATTLLTNPDITKVFQVGDAAQQQPLLNGLPERWLGGQLKLVKSWRLDPDKAIVCQSGVVGGISDERPIGATPLYEDRPTETWRTDVTRASAIFIDQPKAGITITGVNGGNHTLTNF